MGSEYGFTLPGYGAARGASEESLSIASFCSAGFRRCSAGKIGQVEHPQRRARPDTRERFLADEKALQLASDLLCSLVALEGHQEEGTGSDGTLQRH